MTPPPLRVSLLADMREEAWPSMDLVADMLAAHLQDPACAVAPRLVRPRLIDAPFQTGKPTTRVRVLNRFWLYRRALIGLAREIDVFHIVDHSYAHLALDLPPERTVITCHDVDAFTEPPGDGGLPGFLRARLIRGMRRAAMITCDSEVTRHALVRAALAPSARTVVVPNGVDECTVPDRVLRSHAERLLGPADRVEILHVGSTIPRKRLDVLLRVFAAVRAERPDAHLIRVGGPFTPEQQALAESLGISGCISVMPPLARDELHALYRRAAIMISTSEREGFGLPVAEALAAGTPIVVSDIPIFREVAAGDAEFVPLEDVETWTCAVLGLIDERERDPERWLERQARARARGREFSWANYARRMAGIYRDLASNAVRVHVSDAADRRPASVVPTMPAPETDAISLIAATLRGRTTQWSTADVVAAGGADAILATAREQGVNGLLWQADRASGVLDRDVRAALAADARAEVTREMLRHAELGALAQDLAAAGCRALFFKGSALAYSHYPEPWMRPRVDTDVLVDADGLSAAHSTLRARGYAPVTSVSSGAFVSHQRVYERVGRTGVRHLIDLHWKIVNPQLLAGTLRFEELWRTGEPIRSLDDTARTLAPVNALVLACIHRLAHHQGRDRLVWLHDIHLLAGRLAEEEWESFAALAEARQVAGLCRDGLARVMTMFGTPVPEPTLNRLAAARATEPSRTYLDGPVSRRDVLLSDLAVLGGWNDRFRLIREHAFPAPAYVLDRYRTRNRAWLPLLYAHRLIAGSYRWIRP